MIQRLYPLTFEPLLKEIIWGGQDIRPFKRLEPNEQKIGESWEISHVDDNYSVVAQGELRGENLDTLFRQYGARLVGESVLKRFPERFPLLIKFIDAQDNLSIQVHPDDTLGMARHNSFGKTEMWYVVKASPEAKLYSGFSKQSSPEDYVQRIAEGTIMDVMQEYQVEAGNVFFLPAGRVHAIGAGCFVAEIQQTSNITYRIYDYDRRDAQGNTRELHTELAKDAIDYTLHDSYRTDYTPIKNEPTHLVKCQYFETNLLDLDSPLSRDWSALDSFVIYIVMEGKLSLTDDAGHTLELKQGQSVLLPAEAKGVTLRPEGSCKLMETYIPEA
ncbi:MAG: type I phosphomannose isomerase catalytic subunit [Porphyromonas sp.]|nr:type I phosphomannose isomerase catalytic subunit [Porphyromonas sp.]